MHNAAVTEAAANRVPLITSAPFTEPAQASIRHRLYSTTTRALEMSEFSGRRYSAPDAQSTIVLRIEAVEKIVLRPTRASGGSGIGGRLLRRAPDAKKHRHKSQLWPR